MSILFNRQGEAADPYTRLPTYTARSRRASLAQRPDIGLGFSPSTSTSGSLPKIRTQDGESRFRSVSMPPTRQVPLDLAVETETKNPPKSSIPRPSSRLPRPRQTSRKHQQTASLNMPRLSIPRPTNFDQPLPSSPTKSTTPLIAATVTSTTETVPSRRFMKDRPDIIVKHLESLLGLDARLVDVLPVDDLVALHEREAMESATRLKSGQISQSLSVLGIPLRQTSHYASTKAILGKYEHDLPIIVFSCVEELYRFGLSITFSFEDFKHESKRLQELIAIFDSPERQFGAAVLLSNERLEDIYALLVTYLSHLPEPIFAPMEIGGGLRNALWTWCFEPAYHMSTPSMIRIAQLLLRLLPSPNLSLFVYLVAFACQMVAIQTKHKLSRNVPVSPAQVDIEKDLGAGNFGQTFGPWMFGTSVSPTKSGASPVVEENMDEKAAVMMTWFIRNWGEVINGLFDDLPPLGSSTWKSLNKARSPNANLTTLIHEDVSATPRAGNGCFVADLASPSPSLAELAHQGLSPLSPVKVGVVRHQYGFLTLPCVDDSGCAASIIDVEITVSKNDDYDASAEVSEINEMSRSSSAALNERLYDTSLTDQAHIPSLQLPEASLPPSPSFSVVLTHVRPIHAANKSFGPSWSSDTDTVGSPELELDERYRRPLVVVNRTPSDESLFSPSDADCYSSADESLYAMYDSTCSEVDGDPYDGVSAETQVRVSGGERIGSHSEIRVAMNAEDSEVGEAKSNDKMMCSGGKEDCRMHAYVRELERKLEAMTRGQGRRDVAAMRTSSISVAEPWTPL
ncbi:Rho GTPase activation protein [Moniliophthora roreri]|uniref:Rho-GAP domain-containing protein n=1 Tax=Moniliophthora roreri TaxID=221103 RepID=A0A0W0FHP7_MONRR|nr:Rho GTPase activation protein [Moniliophthora roreri]